MDTTKQRELLWDTLPALKALRYRTTISVPPDPSRSLGDGLSDEAVTLLEKLDGKGYYIVDPEGGSGQAATELFERGLLNLDVSKGGAYYVANELAERNTRDISIWHRLRPDVLEEAKRYLTGARRNLLGLFSDMPMIRVPEGNARSFLLDVGYIETFPRHDRMWLLPADVVAVTPEGQFAARGWAMRDAS